MLKHIFEECNIDKYVNDLNSNRLIERNMLRINTHQDEERRDDVPADPEKQVRVLSGHVLHVGGQPLGSVDPDDGHRLEEGDVHERERSGVVVDDLEPVDAAL